MNFYPFFRALLFRLDPEDAHQLTLQLIKLAGEIRPARWMLRRLLSTQGKPVSAFGLSFKNPIGLAAGYDKDGDGWRGLTCLGFGHIEVGTVTPKAQSGNLRPRIYRLKEDRGLINRMGFPSRGEEYVRKRIEERKSDDPILGVNIGKNKDTPNESAAQDYLHLFNVFAGIVDYLTVNVSSPNTVGLRQLQEKQALGGLLSQLNEERRKLAQSGEKNIPILVKLAPDLDDDQLDEALDAILANQMDGVVATNTTLTREGVKSELANENGGLSGLPLFPRSLNMVAKINRRTGGVIPVVGVGGVMDGTSAQQMLDAGAVLVQIYTGLVYEGPSLVKKIIQQIQ